MKDQAENRIAYLDKLRILASFFVVLIHVLQVFWIDRTPTVDQVAVVGILDTVAYVAVPIFFMISGALFLSPKLLGQTRTGGLAIKYILTLAVWALIFSIIRNFSMLTTSSPRSGLQIILDGTLDRHYHLWFLPQLIILYLITPYIRKIINNSSRLEVKNLLKLFAVGAIMLSLNYLIPALFNYQGFRLILNPFVGSFAISAGYYILGYYLHNFEISAKTREKIYILGILGYILSVSFMLSFFQRPRTGAMVLDNFFISILAMSTAIFTISKYKFKDKKSSPKLKFWAEQTLGIYLIHPLFVDYLVGKRDWLAGTDFLVRVLLLSVIMYLFSLVATIIFNKISSFIDEKTAK